MPDVRDYLANVVSKRIEAHGIVVWEDPQREYESTAASVSPPGTTFVRWDGSWYKLRRDIEPHVSGPTPPSLLIYQPVDTPKEDPLAEAREAGHILRYRLATLTRHALAGRFTEPRIEEVAAQARTLSEVDVALAAGEGSGVRLPAALGTADPLQLALRILADDTGALMSEGKLWGEARQVLLRTVGGEPTGENETLRNAVFRHLLLCELKQAGEIPSELKAAIKHITPDQGRRASEVLRVWRSDRTRLASYRDHALRAEQDLELSDLVQWRDGFSELDSFPALEDLALGRVIALLDEGNAREAATLAEKRRTASMWVRGEIRESEKWAPLWEASAAIASLRATLADCPAPTAIPSVEGFLRWYSSQGWHVDSAHRRMEGALTEVATYGPLEEMIRNVRTAYEDWLSEILERFTATVEKQGLETGSMLRQGAIHKELQAEGDQIVAFFLVDALRYEVGSQLADALRADHAKVELRAAVAAAPTITPVGMANLLPGAELGLRLNLSTRDDLDVFVDGTRIRGVPDRVALLRSAHGEVADFPLTDIFDQGEAQLRQEIGSARFVLIRSQEIDEAFESDKTAAAWSYVKGIRSLITRAIARLAAAGVTKFVVTSDHGFLILSRALSPARLIDPPGGLGDLHRRCWIGRGGTAPVSTLRLSLADVGIQGDLDLICPRGLALFSAGGARRFFHGGLSPQELVIPVIEVRAQPPEAAGKPKIKVQIAGSKIATGVFSAAISFEPDLFTRELRVRVIARNRGGDQVARIVTGDGYEEQAGSVLLGSEHPQVLTFRVTSRLAKGDRVILELYAAEGDRLAAKSAAADVVATVEAGDGLS